MSTNKCFRLSLIFDPERINPTLSQTFAEQYVNAERRINDLQLGRIQTAAAIYINRLSDYFLYLVENHILKKKHLHLLELKI